MSLMLKLCLFCHSIEFGLNYRGKNMKKTAKQLRGTKKVAYLCSVNPQGWAIRVSFPRGVSLHRHCPMYKESRPKAALFIWNTSS